MTGTNWRKLSGSVLMGVGGVMVILASNAVSTGSTGNPAEDLGVALGAVLWPLLFLAGGYFLRRSGSRERTDDKV
jgi:glycerol uptake facilitator-like aquaporin